MAPIELRSPRLLLRRLENDDLAALCAYRSLPDVARFQDWDSFSLQDGVRLIAEQSSQEENVSGTWLQLAIVRQDNGEMIGDCGMHFRREDVSQMELGITLAPSQQGHGYATEALTSVIDHAFARLNSAELRPSRMPKTLARPPCSGASAFVARGTSSRMFGSKDGGGPNSRLHCFGPNGRSTRPDQGSLQPSPPVPVARV